ncbi:MAG: rane-associated phospholipid phosphatase [Frankiales bacterium]|nr:rane-associated phospholipid phosphatase [Frankiales bacterium]
MTAAGSVRPVPADHADHSGPPGPVRHAAAKLLVVAVALFGLLYALGWLLTRSMRPDSGLGSIDAGVDEDLARHRTAWLVRTTYWITQAAQTRTVIVLAALAVIVLFAIFRRWQQPVFVAATLAGEVVIFVLTTFVVHRHRPDVPQLDPAPPTSSFPSGHAAASVAMYGALAVVIWRTNWRRVLRMVIVVLLALIPIAVGLARVYRGMHYPTDVIGGLVLGSLWLTATTALLWPVRR